MKTLTNKKSICLSTETIKFAENSNKAVNNILWAGAQPKLKIGAINDPAKIQADRVADQVMRMPELSNRHAELSTKSNPNHKNRKGSDCDN